MNKYINRELSWISFNKRVLGEALNRDLPLLERLKFLSIVSSNFDEFFMVRVATIKRQQGKGEASHCPSGVRPSELLKRIEEKISELVKLQYTCLLEEILPGLKKGGMQYKNHHEYSDEQEQFSRELFSHDIFHTLTPARIDPEQDFPFTANLRTYILFTVRGRTPEGSTGKPEKILLQVPQVLKRVFWLPEEGDTASFTFLEDIILHNAGKLFPDASVEAAILFRVTRDADLSVDEEQDEDFVDAMSKLLQERKRSIPIRIEIQGQDQELIGYITETHNCRNSDRYLIPGPLDLSSLMGLVYAPGFSDLRTEEWEPVPPPFLPEDEPLWDILKRGDILLHHPYDSFDPVVKLVQDAAQDPNVLAVKITLYRTSGNSPIAQALKRAAESGKQVTALVELKARFDEERNIDWAEQLERSGVIVVYGIAHLKVHAKALIIIRREAEGVKRYLHLSTGNYNEKTAALYTDLGLITADPSLTYEATLFFNAITGYSSAPSLNYLVMAPVALKEKLLSLIERETLRSTGENPGLIMAKMNSLADTDIIEALYKASSAGIRILLNIRGICMLVPSVPGLSENISVVSIVGKFLEHSRIFYFYNSGQEEYYCSSADWMPRNLERRVELMFPILQENIRKKIKGILETFFRDTGNAYSMKSDGSYEKKKPGEKSKPFYCQKYFQEKARKKGISQVTSPKKEFTVRRKPPQNA